MNKENGSQSAENYTVLIENKLNKNEKNNCFEISTFITGKEFSSLIEENVIKPILQLLPSNIRISKFTTTFFEIRNPEEYPENCEIFSESLETICEEIFRLSKNGNNGDSFYYNNGVLRLCVQTKRNGETYEKSVLIPHPAVNDEFAKSLPENVDRFSFRKPLAFNLEFLTKEFSVMFQKNEIFFIPVYKSKNGKYYVPGLAAYVDKYRKNSSDKAKVLPINPLKLAQKALEKNIKKTAEKKQNISTLESFDDDS